MIFLESLWQYIILAGPYLMLGLLVAGIIKAFLPSNFIKDKLGGKSRSTIFKAALLGVPLPLCSCSVLPTAVTLKKSGATNGATSAFLISTPETGVDSITMTYGMLDLPMTILRPVAAFIAASAAGLMQHYFNKDKELVIPNKEAEPSCCCTAKQDILTVTPKLTIIDRIKMSFKYGFFELLEDISMWLSFGIIAGSLIYFFIPLDTLEGLNGFAGRLLIILVGIPFYICASASTPIAASLMLKGMSPGTALLFLMVGPATNISGIFVMKQYIGKKGVIINIATLSIVGLILSFCVDFLYSTLNLPLSFNISKHLHQPPSVFVQILGGIFLALLLRALIVKELLPRIKKI